MFVDLRQQYEDRYNSLVTADRELVDHILYHALGWGYAHICSSCLQKYLVLYADISSSHRHFILSEDYLIKKHIGEAAVCEISTCCNEAEYKILINE